MKKILEENIAKIAADLVEWRRHIHQNPELSNKEEKTSNFIVDILEKLGIEYERQKNNYGVIAKIKGKNSGKKIAFRADMDALPIFEENNIDYKSKNEGVMHACGHDAHMAILLGTIKVLKEFQNLINGEILFVFQPAEELSPIGGARKIIESSALEKIDRIYGLHVWPEIESGKIGFKDGELMAASDHFYIDIVGKSSHAAEPFKGIDALVAAANWVTEIQSTITRQISPLDNIVLTFGLMQSGVRYNVIAADAKLEGTCRTFNPEVRDFIEKKLKESLEALDMMYGTNSKIDYQRGYPALINDEESIDFAKNVAKKYFDIEDVVSIKKPSMCAEDFAFYLKKYKGAFFWLGTGFEGNTALHNSKFNVDEKILKKGVLIFSSIALEFFKN